MSRYKCTICGYVYDPAIGDEENGVAAGTSFEDLPDEPKIAQSMAAPIRPWSPTVGQSRIPVMPFMAPKIENKAAAPTL